MIRFLSEGIGLFLLPFALYGGFVALRTRLPTGSAHWSNRTMATLAAAGLGLAILGLVVLGLLSTRHQGAYRPAHIENGRLVPGQMD